MLKILIMSFLAGSGALFAGIYLVYSPAYQFDETSPMVLDNRSIRAVKGSGSYRQEAFHLQVDLSGEAILMLPTSGLQLDYYPYVHIVVGDQVTADSLDLLWQSKNGNEKVRFIRVPHRTGKSLWMTMSGVPGWQGEAMAIGIRVLGKPGEKIVLEQIELVPASLTAYLRSNYLKWVTFYPWSGSSINLQAGVSGYDIAWYPVPLVAAILALSLLAYALQLTLFRSSLRFDMRILSALFVIAWLSLDLVWQEKLLHQLKATRSQFSGKDTRGMLASGPDRNLYRFIEEILPYIDSPNARVFVGSANEYHAMRSAYYLFPFNVFWERDAAELPDHKYLHRGDYLVLIAPSRLDLDTREGTLSLPDNTRLPVETLLTRPHGRLLRVL